MARGRWEKVCRKVRYRDLPEARAALRRITRAGRRRHDGDKTLVRAYECGRCKGTHLTAVSLEQLEIAEVRRPEPDRVRPEVSIEAMEAWARRVRGLDT